MFVATTPVRSTRSRTTPGRWPAPRPTWRPDWPGSVTAPAGSAGSATTRSAGSSTPRCPHRHRHPARHARPGCADRLPVQVPRRRRRPGGRVLPEELRRLPTSIWPPGGYIGGARHLHVTGIPLALSASTRDFAFRAAHVARAAWRHRVLRHQPAAGAVGQPARDDRVTTRWLRAPTWCSQASAKGSCCSAPRPGRDRETYLDMGASTVVVKDGGNGRPPDRRGASTAGCFRSTSSTPSVPETVSRPDSSAGTLDRLTPRRLRRAAAVGAMATTSPGDRDGLPNRLQLKALGRGGGGRCGPGRGRRAAEAAAWRCRSPWTASRSTGPERHFGGADFADWIEVGTSLVKRYG